MRRRDISKALLASAAGSTLLTRQAEAQTCTPPCFPRTAAEIAANVMPVSYAYPEGNVLRYMTSSQIADVLSLSATVNVATAIQNAISVDCPLYFPNGRYLMTESLTKTNSKGFHWSLSKHAVLVNKASADKPSIVITDCQYWKIEGGNISGRAGFPNHGILLTTAGGQTSSFFEIRDIGLEPNGNGIEFIKLNTGQVSGVEYWPSGSLGIGSTRDSGQAKFAFLNNNGIAGNYCNGVSFTACNAVGVDSSIVGHACFYLGGPNGVQNITIFDCELEGIGLTALDATGAYNLKVMESYLENSDIRLQSCRHSEIDTCYGLDDVTLVTCVDVRVRNLVFGSASSSFTIGVGCVGCGAEHAELVNAPSDSGTNSIFEDWSIGGVKQPDKRSPAGVCEFGRTVANGVSITPTFAAADYVATVGTWMVAPGDVMDMTVAPISGKRIQVDFDIRTTSTQNGPTSLIMRIPGGYIAGPKDKWFSFIYSQDNGVTTLAGVGRVVASGQSIQLARDLANTAFSNVTNSLLVRGSAVFEIA